jgi:hypothetical protein
MSKKKKTAEKAPPRGASEGFRRWWEPTDVDELSGAHIGGHPDALRIWARKDPGRWVRRAYGTPTDAAYLVEYYRQQYDAWVDAGKPKGEPFVSVASTVEQQKEWARGVKGLLLQIGRPMPKTHYDVTNPRRGDVARPAKARVVEPLAIGEGDDAIDFTRRNNEGEE